MLKIKETVKGKEPTYCLDTTEKIASMLEKQGKFSQSLDYFKNVLKIKETVNGKETINCMDTTEKIAFILEKQGKLT